jgi:hypothetical protein
MGRSALAAVLMAALALGALFTPCPASGDEPVLIDSFGVWTLRQLGATDMLFPVDGDFQAPLVSYRLPSGASQGPDTWYMIHLHFQIEFAEDSADGGSAYVSASTNAYACAQIEFKTARANDALTVTWSSAGLLNETEEISSSPLIEVPFSNYLQTSGVRPGCNILTLQLEQYEGAKVKSLRVFDDSGIEYTPLAPPGLELGLTLPEDRVGLRVGDTFSIKYELANHGGPPVTDVSVGAIYPEEAFEVVDENPQHFSSIDGKSTGSFTFKAIAEGTYRIVIGAESTGSQPIGEIQAVVGPLASPATPWATAAPWIVVAALVSAVMVMLARRLIARRGRSR